MANIKVFTPIKSKEGSVYQSSPQKFNVGYYEHLLSQYKITTQYNNYSKLGIGTTGINFLVVPSGYTCYLVDAYLQGDLDAAAPLSYVYLFYGNVMLNNLLLSEKNMQSSRLTPNIPIILHEGDNLRSYASVTGVVTAYYTVVLQYYLIPNAKIPNFL